jgi:hypothetical protein
MNERIQTQTELNPRIKLMKKKNYGVEFSFKKDQGKHSDLLNATNNQNLKISDKSSQVCELKLEIQKMKSEIDDQKDHIVEHNEEAQKTKNKIEKEE